MTYLPRHLNAALTQASRQFPVVMLTGPRQVGKTTLLKTLSAEISSKEAPRRYVTLDDPMLLSLAQEDPALFLQRFPPPLLIDEIQYAPGLLPLIKAAVDRQGGASSKTGKGQYWLTGSQPFHLMRGVSESLAGRVAALHLQGLTLAESMGLGASAHAFLPVCENAGDPLSQANHPLCTPPDDQTPLAWIFNVIWRGSFPALHAEETIDHDLFYASYLQTYLQRDVRDLTQVGDLSTFTRFLRSAAARTAQLLNLAEMARDVGIAPNTARQWLSILQASGVVWLLEPYHTNLSKRIVKAPKLYFLDTGLASYLTQWSSPATLEAGDFAWAKFENWVVCEILKSWWHSGQEAPLYYYRDRDGKEIDLLIVRNGTACPIEIKKTAQPGRDAIRHFSVLENSGLSVGSGAVICLCAERLPLTPQVDAIPAWQLGG